MCRSALQEIEELKVTAGGFQGEQLDGKAFPDVPSG
jgi:hypothetical protein